MKDAYHCPRCGYVLPKEEAIVSGWDSQSSLRHVLVFRTNLLGTLNPAARSLALIIPSAANIIIFLFYIEHIQKTATPQD